MKGKHTAFVTAFVSASVLSAALAGCNSKVEKGTEQDTLTPVVSASEVSYALVNQYVFAKSCTGCHDSSQAQGGINLETYGNASGFAKQIKAAVETGRMPKSPAPPLSQRQKNLVAIWAEQGAPNEAGGAPAAPAPVLEAKFASIKNGILKFKCDTCHNPTGKAKRFLFDTPEHLLTGQRVLVVPGKPEESVLLKVVLPRPDGRPPKMPPQVDDRKPLTAAETELIRGWIAAGAQDDAQFKAIQSEIIQKEKGCADCHTFEGSAEAIPLDTLKDLTDGGTPFVIPGEPMKSLLATTSKPGDDRSMPPKRSDAPPLTQEEWNVIKEWIANGANQ